MRINKIAVLIFICCLLSGHTLVFAQEPTDSVELSYIGSTESSQEIPLSDMEITLYYVATSSVGGDVSSDFDHVSVDLSDMGALSVSEQADLAEKLEEYAAENQIEGMAVTTDQNGYVKVQLQKRGVYLVVPENKYFYETGMFVNAPFLLSVPANGNGQIHLAPKVEWVEGIVISPARLTVYTGGYNIITGEEDGFPEPVYDGIPENAKWKVNGELWTEDSLPFDTYYMYSQDQFGNMDAGIEAENDDDAGVYVAKIRPIREEDLITCSIDGFETEMKVNFENGILIVRNITKANADHQMGNIKSELTFSDTVTDQMKEKLSAGQLVAAASVDSEFYINGKYGLGQADKNHIGLLYDDLLYFNTIDDQTGGYLLESRAEDYMAGQKLSMENRKYVTKYLDLLDYTNGNIWVSSTKGVDVYWPYPEGTDENTEFTLLHFLNLHREYGILGNGSVDSQIRNSEIEMVTIENTEYGIKFHVPESGFSPFVLSWNEKKGGFNIVKTGDNSQLLFYGLLFAAAAIVMGIIFYKKKNK